MGYSITVLENLKLEAIDFKTVVQIRNEVSQEMEMSRGARLARLRAVAQRIDDLMWRHKVNGK